MSLKLGKSFISALRSNTGLLKKLGANASGAGARLYCVARPTEDEDADRVPYLIVEPNGINTEGTKDEYEATDTCTIGILCVESTYSDLVDLTVMVRETIEEYLTSTEEFQVDDYTFSADAVQYDPTKPCYFQTLTYQVSTQEI